MDKYIEVLCKQNPKISFPCGNPDCKKEHTFKSKDVFKNKTYQFVCENCGKTTEVDTTKLDVFLLVEVEEIVAPSTIVFLSK